MLEVPYYRGVLLAVSFSPSWSSSLPVKIFASSVLAEQHSVLNRILPYQFFSCKKVKSTMSWKKIDKTSWQQKISSSGEINVNAPLHWRGAEVLELVCSPFGDKAGMNLLFIKSLAVVVTESWRYLLVSRRAPYSLVFMLHFVIKKLQMEIRLDFC